ncbi:MAG: asparagine synthase-related protein [Candidatus Nanoarchaeia archaeon]|nr:asparagine synthase-related protein [Candidatus Nanoarchaeia archaeon]
MLNDTIIKKLTLALENNYSDSILLSGGLDSSTLLALSVKKLNRKPLAVTVSMNENCSDFLWAKKVTEHLSVEHNNLIVSPEEAIEEGLPELIKLFNSFDIGLLNDLPCLFAVRTLKEKGYKNVMNGDGSDWLFGGFQFSWELKEKYNEYIKGVLKHIDWSSKKITSSQGIRLTQPFLDEAFVRYALEIPFSKKVNMICNDNYGDVAVGLLNKEDRFYDKATNKKMWGKLALRNALSDFLPNDVIWRQKTDLEFGSGTSELSRILEEKISDEEYNSILKETNIIFIGGKAQAYLYKIYKEWGGKIYRPTSEESCINCGNIIPTQRRHCQTCGYFDETKRSIRWTTSSSL